MGTINAHAYSHVNEKEKRKEKLKYDFTTPQNTSQKKKAS